MWTRRTFLRSSALAAGAPLACRLAAASTLRPVRILAVREGPDRETPVFASDWSVFTLAPEPSGQLMEIAAVFAEKQFDIVFGLTRDSSFVLLQQFAAPAGYELVYQGIHEQTGAHLAHTLRGPEAAMKWLPARLSGNAADWRRPVTHIPVLWRRGETMSRRAQVVTPVRRPAGGMQHLVSWMWATWEA